jgi:tripartite-type tricarboxylate transporter receptor subunit TctC
MEMVKTSRRTLLQVGLAVALTGQMTSGWAQSGAQDVSANPIRILVGFSAGGTTDALARIIAESLSSALKTSVVVENKPGANGNIAAAEAARASKDGTTLYMGSFNSPVHHAARRKLPFDFLQDFAPVAMVAYVPNVLVVKADFPAHSVEELIALAKQQPNKLTFASAGAGSSLHMAGELFKNSTGAAIMHVPYKGSAPAISDLLGGHVDMMFDNLPSAMAMIEAGKLRALGVTSAKRAPALPNVPTIGEAGVPGFEVLSFFALFAPTGTPAATINAINAQVNAALAVPAVQEKIAKLGAWPSPETPAQLGDYVDSEVKKWEKVIQDQKITFE